MLPAVVLCAGANSFATISPPGVVDTDTQGTWKGIYGTDGYILAAFDGSTSSGTDRYSLPSYISSYSVNGLSRWTWATGTSDPYDLQQPGSSVRSIGCWYTAGSGDITLVPNQDKTFQLSVYLRDYGGSSRWDDLSFSGVGLVGTDSIQCTDGKWITYTVTATAGTNVVLTLGYRAGPNSTISALLFDPAPGTDTTPPGAVSNLATGIATPSTITLTWTATGNDGSTGMATGYDIRYRTDGAVNEGNWASATQVTGEPPPEPAGTSQSMVVSGLSPSTTYYFAIKARDGSGNIAAISNSPSGQTLAADTTAPAAVSNLATGSATFNSITLSWTAPGDDNSTGTATSYDIRYSTSVINDGNWASATQVIGEPTPAPAGASQSMVLSGLSPTTTYFVAMKTADEAANWSALSNVPTGTTAALPPTGVVALKRTAGLVAGGAIDARFAAAAPVTTTVEDAVTYSQQISRWYNGGTATAGGNDAYVFYRFDLARLPQLAYAKINLAQLRLYHTFGNSNAGLGGVSMVLTHDWIEGTRSADYPGAAGGVTFWAPIAYNTDFDQNPSGGASQPWGGWGLNSDTYFDLNVDAGPVINPSSAPVGTGFHVINVTSHVQIWVRGAYPNLGWVQNTGVYDFQLCESGPDYQPVLFIDYALEGDTTPPATIANLATGGVTNHSIALTWTAPGDDGAMGIATAYDIRYARSPITAASWVLATPVAGVPAPQTAGTVQSMVIDNLPGNTTYYFAIKARDEVPNVTPLSNVVFAQTLPDTIPPAAVANLAASSATNHSFTLTWTAPGDDGSSGTAATYDIRYSTSPIDAGNWDAGTQVANEPTPAVAGTSQNLVVDNLTQNTTYYFAMKTADEVPNTSGLSNVASGQTLPDTIAPGAVTGLTVTKTKSSALRLAWIASGDDGADRTATSYDVRYRTGGPVTEGNWASCAQVTGKPAAVLSGYHRSLWISGLSPSTTYYIGIKAYDEVGNASTIAMASATLPATSNLTRPLIQPDDMEFLGAFKLPQYACGHTTSDARSGIALRRVNGNLQFLSCTAPEDNTGVNTDAVYECSFPGWGADESTWPQSQVIREWGMAVYGTPCVKPSHADWTIGLNYDQATGRLYYSYANVYNVNRENIPSLSGAALEETGAVLEGTWNASNIGPQVRRGGSLTIPDWFADTYLAGRKLGVGFGGDYSGWSGVSPGPALAAAHHPAPTDTDLDTIRLLEYDLSTTDTTHWCTRDAGYWYDSITYFVLPPVGDIGYWGPGDGVSGAGVWIDLPDKQGLLYMTGMAYGKKWYDYGTQDCDRWEDHWQVYDPADLAEVAQGHMNCWEPPHDEWKERNIPDPVNHRPGIAGLAFDVQTRTLFVIVARAYNPSGQSWYPVVYGYRIKESFNVCDVDKDGHVDVVDLLYFVDAFGSVTGDPDYDSRCDVNSDGFVDMVDLLMLVENFGL